MRGLFIAIGGVILALFAFFEILVGFPVAWWLYLAVSVFLLTGLLAPAGPDRNLAIFQRSALVVSALLAWALYLVPWNSRKPFLKDLDRIEIGMSEAEVREIMAGYITGTGWPTPPSFGEDSEQGGGNLTALSSGTSYATETADDGELAIKNSIVFRHSTDGAYNSDWGVVSFEKGRVVGTEFMPD